MITRINAAVKKTGIPRSSLLRMLVTTWVEAYEATGQAALPNDWKEIIRGNDGRKGAQSDAEIMARANAAGKKELENKGYPDFMETPQRMVAEDEKPYEWTDKRPSVDKSSKKGSA